MRCTVIWDKSATNELARLWLSASDQQAVADAADAIDYILRTEPDKVGMIFGLLRRFRQDPLEVDFLVSLADCLVTVKSVHRAH